MTWMSDVLRWNDYLSKRADSRGFVNFPSADAPQSGENGLNVFLVVINEYDTTSPEADLATHWPLCSEGWITLEGGNFQGNQHQSSWSIDDDSSDNKISTVTRKYFSHYDERNYSTQPLLFAAHIGTTRYSFLRDDNYWRCTYDDLTEEGRQLVALVELLYPGHEWSLLTFLDT